ncbi:MAG: methionyl-tRNA formyltransferase, partial [Anaerolineales bacterium]
LNGAITPTPQDDSQATFAPPISREDALIHWELPAMAIERRVRAYDPWPGAYTTLHGQTLKVLAASVASDAAPDMPAGTVIRLPAGLGVVTGDGVLMLERVQLAGKKPMAATDLARGHRDLVGARLGE